jgi:hypothetical protein
MILTVGGFCLGAFAMLELLPGGAPAPAVAGPVRSWSGWWALAAVALSVWAVRETVRLWRSRPPGRLFRDLPFSERYRLSTAAALIGLSNGVLNFLFGSWSHTGTFLQAMEGLTQKNAMPSVMKWILLVALFGGMVFSTWQRRGFRLDWRPSFVWWRNLVGGLAMGGGAVLVPGGNDTLVLQGIPGLSAHALPAYLAMLIGIATSLLAMRWIARTQMIVDCSNDICISREESRRRRPSFPSGAIGTIKPDDGSFSRIRPRPSSNGDLSKRSIRGRGRR